MEKKTTKEKLADFKLKIPLDASGIKDFKSEQDVKVVAKDRNGNLHSEIVKLSENGQGTATIAFSEIPGPLRVIIGPANASDDELVGLQTLNFNISSRRWGGIRELTLKPIPITAYYWYWWLRWCRTFTIRGRILCPDGSPVPGAQVCAYDVDWFLIWRSTQLVGCDTTDTNGAFEFTFRWCCGWWPWWWWRLRAWQFDPVMAKQVNQVFQRSPELQLSRATNQPSLSVFNNLLVEEGLDVNKPLEAMDIAALQSLRKRLLERLPSSPELERLHIWPWWPWWPWWDCTPDIIFKVTQDCVNPDTVIFEESVADTRWNIPTTLDVTLIANEDACCLQQDCQDEPCDEGECLIVDQVCQHPMTDVGGNLSAPAVPEGYLHPGAVTAGTYAYNADRPFAGIIPVWKNPGDMVGVDYYEIEYFAGGIWRPLPTGAEVNFRRLYFDVAAGLTAPPVSFNFDATLLPGHNVVMSREHYEDISGLDWNPPGVDAIWYSTNYNLLVPLDTSKFADGTHRFRAVGWELDGGGNLVNPRVLPVCGTSSDNEFVLTFDNRLDPDPAHPTSPSHVCEAGTVHRCTTEPDTDFIAVRVDGNPINPCDVVELKDGILEIDFMAHDPDGHLALYSLFATYGEGLANNLLNKPSSVLTPLTPAQQGPTYGQALGQGATAPYWHGGTFRLRVSMHEAFPEPCCYQLELRAWKRTVVGYKQSLSFWCQNGYAHWNKSEFTIGVGVCPTPTEVVDEIVVSE